jgi:Holliday junction DNA helicase RuvA
MIGKLTGRVDYKATDHVLLDVSGVGYVVYCAQPTLALLPAAGGMAALYTDLVVREDLLQLYGFATLAEREWHRLLTSVQGVGAKAALAISGTLGADNLARAIALGDWNAVKAAPGVGPKLAQRVVNELKDKAPQVMAMGAAGARRAEMDEAVVIDPSSQAPTPRPRAPGPDTGAAARADALSALANLGYAPGEAASAIAEVMGDDPDGNVSDLIRRALKKLAPKG